MNYTAETMLIRAQDSGGTGEFARVRPQDAGWEYLNMAALRLNRGQKLADNTGEHENALVIVRGSPRGWCCRGAQWRPLSNHEVY